MDSSVSYSTRKEIEVHSFSGAVTLLVPLAAILLQAFVSLRIPMFRVFDLPLLVTIFFAVARRNPIAGSVTGALIGTGQDAASGLPVGINGIANTVVGYFASSISVKIDVENPGSRLIMIFGFKLLHDVIGYLVQSRILGNDLLYRTRYELGSALANAVLGVALFGLLDRLKQRR
ncbi:MAG: rod shape-determining protein MreD [Acidobacteriaceae bacterium]